MDSVVTFFQSHSSSSATSWARPVSVPCPISERAMRITHVSSGLTTTQALISASAADPFFPFVGPSANARGIPRASPPPAAAEPTMKRRRESAARPTLFCFMSGPLLSGGHLNGRPDALIGAATADVGHRFVDLLIGGVWPF